MSGRQYLLGLGGNLGDRAQFIADAIDAIGKLPGAEILAISEAVDSDPVGYKDQGNFLNICIAITYAGTAHELLGAALLIEEKLGRVRTIKDGPRTVDIDILFIEDGREHSETLTVPHPRWRERGFVVIPLRDLLQSPALAKNRAWDFLRSEVANLSIGSEGLRKWQGPTPWMKTLR